MDQAIVSRILIVDDEPDMAENCRRILDAAGYRCLTTSDALEALRLLGSEHPDLLLTDLRMPEIDGMEMLRQACQIDPRMPVVLLTAHATLESAVAAVKAGAFDYLAKPFSLAQLRQTLRNAAQAFRLGRSPQDRLRERLGHAIKMLRVERDWSLKDLATHTRLSVSQISAIERGTNLPSIESLLAISKAFEKRPSEILGGIDF